MRTRRELPAETKDGFRETALELSEALAAANYGIRSGYIAREEPRYFEDSIPDEPGVVHQPQIYDFAGYLAERYGCTTIIDIGSGRATKLAPLADRFQIVGIDFGANLDYCRRQYDFGQWLEWDLESPEPIPIDETTLESALVVCSDVIEHLKNPGPLLANLAHWLGRAPALLLSTPERDRVRGIEDPGPPANPHHVREWNLAEFRWMLERAGLHIDHLGLTENNDRDRAKKTICAVVGNSRVPPRRTAPDDFRVLAVMTAYNEADIIGTTIARLLADGIEVHLIDNWSDDRTLDVARELATRGTVTIEQFPPEGPRKYYEWRRLLGRVDEIASRSDAHWCLHHDADEIRQAPWEGVGLRDALYDVDRRGFNAIDHTVLVFPPAHQVLAPDADIESAFTHCRFGTNPGHFCQIKGWKNQGALVGLPDSGGHEAVFAGRKVFPYKFLLRHYPFRSQAHGVQKVFTERQPRWDPQERADGWHHQYDRIHSEHQFVETAEALIRFGYETIYRDYLVEAISGVGVRT